MTLIEFTAIRVGEMSKLEIKKILALAIITATLGSAARAEPWSFQDTEDYCVASVVNEEATVFGFRFKKRFPPGTVLISAFNQNWNIPFFAIQIVAETHGRKGVGIFEIDATVIENSSIDLGSVRSVDAFMGGIMFSDILLLKQAGGDVMASFLLTGSNDAMMSAIKCQVKSK